jgi:hypothetical protein
MKFKEDRPFPTPEAAERKLLELANAVEADHAGRLSVAVGAPARPVFRMRSGTWTLALAAPPRRMRPAHR